MRQGQKKLQRYITYSSAYIPEFKWLMCLKRLSALRTPAWFEEAKREPTARSISWRLWSNQLNPTCSNCWLNMEASSKRQIFNSVFFVFFFRVGFSFAVKSLDTPIRRVFFIYASMATLVMFLYHIGVDLERVCVWKRKSIGCIAQIVHNCQGLISKQVIRVKSNKFLWTLLGQRGKRRVSEIQTVSTRYKISAVGLLQRFGEGKSIYGAVHGELLILQRSVCSPWWTPFPCRGWHFPYPMPIF